MVEREPVGEFLGMLCLSQFDAAKQLLHLDLQSQHVVIPAKAGIQPWGDDEA
jgi:hypothetical protein